MTAIKICGITTEQEIGYLNQAGVSYAGFVFYGKSRRNVTPGQAEALLKKLNPNIKKVAVTVNPEPELARQIENMGFDILQVHKNLSAEVLEQTRFPVWRAVNLSGQGEIVRTEEELDNCSERGRIQAVLVDAPDFGSGKTFGWDASGTLPQENPLREFRWRMKQQGRQFILAGGLKPENVGAGISMFAPDIVDVSSGVEGTDGKKSLEHILEFVRAVR